ncbi:MAG: transcriptional repressor [Ilumatobacteraceae bacterium]
MEEADELHRQVGRRLESEGLRYTSSRRIIVTVLRDEGQPMTIPEILTRNTELAQSSVYRNLTDLERCGAVTKVVTASEWSRYELAEDLTGHHHHLICDACGLVRDIELPAGVEHSVRSAMRDLGSEHGFAVFEHRLDLVGHCAACVDTGGSR